MADNGGAPRRTGRRWVLWIVAGIAAAGAVAAVVGLWHLPDRMYPGGEVEMGQARAALQGGLLTAAAALTAVAGGLIALDETRQANAEVRRANAEVRRANENTHVRELYATAISQLGSDSVDVRLGGIYALERVARDSAADQRTVVEVLSAFARVHSTNPDLRPENPDPNTPPVRPTVDVHAAVTVLARLPASSGRPRADLTGANFTGPAALTRLRAHHSNLTGVDLRHADLRQADFRRAALARANLRHADLSGVDFRHADLREADLSHAHLSGADLWRANLRRADFSSADFSDARFRPPSLNVNGPLTGADLSGANLSGANLSAVRGLLQSQVDVARGNATTRLPEGLARPASWDSDH